jgi:hypothetical protein
MGWKRELQALAPRYLAMINRYAGQTVSRIEFVVVSPEVVAPEAGAGARSR